MNASGTRAKKLEALVAAVRRGEDDSELVSLLRESIRKAGDTQVKRAKWLGISPRQLRAILGTGKRGLDMASKYPDVHGREQADRIGKEKDA